MQLDNNYELSSPAAEESLDRMTTMHNYIHDVLKQVNYQWSTLHVATARHFHIDNWVLVDRRNLQVMAENNKSLIRKWLEPYEVIKAIGSYTYQLKVPKGTQWHNVVHNILLQLFRRRDKPQDMDEDEEEFSQVKEIINSRRTKGVVQYQVQ